MKKGFLLLSIISLVVYGGFGAADLSEAKDKLSKHDRQVLEEFKLSFKDSAEGRFQTAKIDDTSILIIDTKLGHLWMFRSSPPQARRIIGSFSAIGVDWFDGFIETYNLMGVPGSWVYSGANFL